MATPTAGTTSAVKPPDTASTEPVGTSTEWRYMKVADELENLPMDEWPRVIKEGGWTGWMPSIRDCVYAELARRGVITWKQARRFMKK